MAMAPLIFTYYIAAPVEEVWDGFLNYDPSQRKMAADRLLRNVIHEDRGPLIHNGSEEAQRSLDSTCRKLHRFLTRS